MTKQSTRADKKKNVDLVAASYAKNPLQTIREVAKDTGVGKSTVATVKNESLDDIGLKDDRIIALTDGDFDMMTEIQVEKLRRLREEKDKLNNSDINRWEETASKRYTLFRGEATDDKGGLKLPAIIEVVQPEKIEK